VEAQAAKFGSEVGQAVDVVFLCWPIEILQPVARDITHLA
jgi:hypothetical protein